MRYICSVMMFIGILTVGLSAQAQQWFVDPAGSDPQDGSAERPFATLHQAMDQAQDGDTLILMPGVYTGPGNVDLYSSGRSLTIRSSEPDNWDIVESTVIDPQAEGGVFVFDGSGHIVLEGLTIQNANKIDSIVDPHGAAILADGVNLDIRYCRFINCQAYLGGAIYFYEAQATISHSIFAGNLGLNGGALISDEGSTIILEHCTLADNYATFGGAAACEFGSTLAVVSSIFWGNDSAERGDALYAIDAGSTITVDASILEGGPDSTFSADGVSDISLTETVIDADPRFAAYDLGVDPSGWDLRLQSSFGRWDPAVQQWVLDEQTSPGIVAGPTTADYSREPWPNGRRANIGAYGNTAQASLFGNIADLNADGRVDMIDLSMLAAVWMDEPIDYEDLTLDGMVYFDDLLVMADNWLWQLP